METENVSSTPSQFSSVLHILSERAEWDQLAQYLHTLDPTDDSIKKELITCEGPNEWTPLMLSCARAPPDTIQLLLERCPESVMIADRSGAYPLHFVCSWKDGNEHEKIELTKVLEHLLEYGPKALNMQNQWGQTPMHCLFDTDDMPSVETVRILLGLQPSAVDESIGSGGGTNKVDESKMIVRKCALKALATPDANSHLPLHLAAKKGAPEELLQLLVSTLPIAAVTANAEGDLPIHLLQYYAEDTVTENIEEHALGQGSWHGDSGIFRPKNSKTFEVVSLAQVESLLEPLCLDSKVRHSTPSTRDDGNESTVDGSSTESSYIDLSAALNLAMRLPGSRSMNLPIHIAAEHGASMHILRSLCDQNPEGPATSQPISRSILASSTSSVSVGNQSLTSPEMFPIEAFEKGRAAIEASQAARDVVCYEGGIEEESKDSVLYSMSKDILKRFEDRSDLLFAFYPDAVPSVFRESTLNDTAVQQRIPFRKDPKRLVRLENLIRAEASDSSTIQLNFVARLVWLWLYRGINDVDEKKSVAQFQGSIGRIVTGLSKEALLNLSFISHAVNDLGIAVESGSDALRNVPCLIQGKSILQYAEARDTQMTMSAMLFTNEKEDKNFVSTLCDFLEAKEALSYSGMCRHTMRSGVRLLPETKLKETGRNWNFPVRQELSGPGQSELWQHLDSKLMLLDSTHTIFVTYYLETSDGTHKSLVNDAETLHEPISGGLLVTSDNSATSSEFIEAQSQKKILYSNLSTSSGFEVQLSFRVKPGRSYCLRVYGPESGGRVSVSNARVRQVIHCLNRDKRTPLQVLLANKPELSYSPLSHQIETLVGDRYGFDDVSSSLLLHFALQSRVSTDVLEALIASNSSLLLETDSKGRTPLHSLFLLTDDEPPSLSTVQLLLGTPGENATRLKDRDHKVPLHLAAEIGSSNAILELLVNAYPDGCYRHTRDGDIPVHLLVRSGRATASSIELLLRPIMDSETICSLGGSDGVNLPLHIASEYNCSYEILERLLLAYGTAASIPMQKCDSDNKLYALDIFEHNRIIESQTSPDRWSTSHRSLGAESMQRFAEDAACNDMEEADFNLRSDLIFVHYPVTPVLHRKNKNRIKRLRNLIRREALECSERKNVDSEAQMSTMSQLAWCFLCTFENREDPSDQYADDVGIILKSLTIPAVKLLASITNPFSSPPHLILSDCSTTECKELITSRLLFVGRYMFTEDFVIHKSENSFVVRVQDHGAIDAYEKIVMTLKREKLSDIDDLESVDEGSIAHSLSSADDEDITSRFLYFAAKLGLGEGIARQELRRLSATAPDENKENENCCGKLTLEALYNFCSVHGIHHDGIRIVVIKFIKHRTHFLREKVTRARLNLSRSASFVLPIIEDYDVDRAENHNNESVDDESIDETIGGNSWISSNSKDDVFAFDRREMNSLGHDFSSFKYALVLPHGDKDLRDLLVHEEIGLREIRELAQKIAIALQELHERRVIHGNLSLSNIVKIGSNVALIDLDSATLTGAREIGSVLNNRVAGISHKFTSGVLPPELIEKIELSQTSDSLKSYLKCWASIRHDADDIASLSIDEINRISNVTKEVCDQIQAMKSKAEKSDIRFSLNRNKKNPEDSWRNIISDSLVSKSIDTLPPSLSNSKTVQEFSKSWARLKSNAYLWERIRPRTRSDGRHAFVIKFHDDLKRTENANDHLPYSPVASSEKIDIWSFGVILFTLCSRGSLFHETVDGDLSDASAYENLHSWNSLSAHHHIKESIRNPLAQDLLLKMLAREEDRISSIREVLEHPFFSPIASTAVEERSIPEYYDRLLVSIDEVHISDVDSSPSDETSDDMNPQDPTSLGTVQMHSCRFCILSMEKLCKVIFARLDDIKVPTSFIVLPYRLSWNEITETFDAPVDVKNLSLAEMVGKHLLRINMFTAKLNFWLRVKENLVESNGKEFNTKIMKWIRRARTEGSVSIAKELVAAIKCDQKYEPICVDMLDEEMSISHARSYMRDPVKAASILINESTNALIKIFENQFMYLIDEHRGSPYLPTDSLTMTFAADATYPIRLREGDQEFRNILLPFMSIAVMVATANDGLCGVSRLLGIYNEQIPNSWKDCTLGLVHEQTNIGRSSIIEFATLQAIIRKEDTIFNSRNPGSSLLMDVSKNTSELVSLESFYQRHDSLGVFAALHRRNEETDESLVFWTQEEVSTTTSRSQQEFSRLEELQNEISESRKLEEEVVKLNKRLNEIKKNNEERMRRKKEKRVRIISPQKSPTILMNASDPDIIVPALAPSSCESLDLPSGLNLKLPVPKATNAQNLIAEQINFVI